MKQYLPLFFAAVSASSLIPRQAQTCYDGVYIIVCRGTFESQDTFGYGFQGSIVSSVMTAIPNSNASSIIYPASVGNYSDSVDQGVANTQQQVTAYHNACPNHRIVLLGYSQGAQVVGAALAGGSTGIPVLGGVTGPSDALPQDVGTNIIAINLLGDPNHVHGQGTEFDPQSCTTGSSTPRNGSDYTNMQIYADRLAEWCHQGDPVCCTDGSNPLSHVGYLLNSTNVDIMTSFIVGKYKASL